MLIPIRTDYRLSRTPWTNYALIAANVLLYVLGYHGDSDKVLPYLLHPDQPQLYQFFSCVFLHGDFWHLAGNMLFLWVFGNAVNDRLGNTGYLGFYLAGGVLAGVGYLLLSGHAPVLGASGAISAVTGAYLVLLPRARVTLLVVWFYYLTTIEVSSLYFLLFQLLFNLFMSLVWEVPGMGGGVAYAAHSTGYAFGIVVAAVALGIGLLPRDAFDLLNLLRARRRRTHYRRMVSQGYDPFNYISSRIRQGQRRWVDAPGPSEPADTAAGRETALRREIAADLARHDLAHAAQQYLQLVQIAEDAALPQNQQLDVANQLMAQERYPAAADAYERFVRHYGGYEHLPDIFLMLGIIYGRYLHQADRARHYLTQAVERLSDPHKLELARADLRALGPAR
jgi:membrane associated rhomboid family serine protease